MKLRAKLVIKVSPINDEIKPVENKEYSSKCKPWLLMALRYKKENKIP